MSTSVPISSSALAPETSLSSPSARTWSSQLRRSRLRSGMLASSREAVAGVEHRVHDLDVAAAAAQVAGQVVPNLVRRRVRLLLEQRPGGQDEARRAVRALER